ncbi:MAG TPA: SDR family oxidoreductase [Syntrophorhabdaceae bacterium]|nr:SDR family oxidoreductase [Syntrophorhabdaceae bacterium]
MRFLVTGGAGFIGSNIVEELVRQKEQVRIIDNFSTGKAENVEPFRTDVELIEGDIRDYEAVREAMSGIDVVLHQAALPSVPRSISDPVTSNEVNVTGTLNILVAARENGVRRVVYASSSSVYGDNPKLPKEEGMIPNPLSPYAVSKLAGEKYCQVFSNIYNLETVSLRYFNVFGRRQDPNSQYSAVIPKFIKAMMNDSSPVIYGDGEQSRDFTYVKNVVSANILAARADCKTGIVMNCACSGQITLNELVEKINMILGKKIEPVYEAPRPGDIKHSFASIEVAEKNLGYRPVVDFDSGIRETVKWYQSVLSIKAG